MSDLEASRPFPEDETIPLTRRPIVLMQQYKEDVVSSRFRRRNEILTLSESLRDHQLVVCRANRDVMPSINVTPVGARAFIKHYSHANHSNYADLPPISSHYPLRSPRDHSYPKQPSYPRMLIYDILKVLGYRTSI